MPREKKPPFEIGRRFGDWEVIAQLAQTDPTTGGSLTRVRCVCGTERTLKNNYLRAGGSNGCGCRRGRRLAVARLSHGKCATPTYKLWHWIKQRLKSQSAYAGVRMHEPWAHNFLEFETFIESLGPKPTPQHTLDRIDPFGHYEPGNLRWADKKTQSENRRGNSHYERGNPPCHGKTGTPNHRLWSAIKYRLANLRSYADIKMHEPWVHDFEAFDAFIESLGPKPTPEHTLDRIDPAGHYEPGNLRWADKKTQSENRRNNKYRQLLDKSIVAVGEKYDMLTVLKLVVERRHGVTWYCAQVQCDCGTLKTVYQKQLLSPKTKSCGCFKNRNLKLGQKKPMAELITANGKTQSMSAWARELGVSLPVIWHRINKYGWDPARAVTEPLTQALIEVDGEKLSAAEWSKRHGVPARTITKRIMKGWEPTRAVTEPLRPWGTNRDKIH